MKTPRLLRNLVDIDDPDEVTAESYGIRLGYPDGRAASRVHYARVSRWLECGSLDGILATGILLALALIIATDEGWYAPPDGDLRAFWCWIVVAVFLLEQLEEGRTVVMVQLPDGLNVPAVLYTYERENVILTPAMLRMQVTHSVEQCSCPAGQHLAYSVARYKRMLAIQPGTENFYISESGCRLFAHFQEWAAFDASYIDCDNCKYRLKH